MILKKLLPKTVSIRKVTKVKFIKLHSLELIDHLPKILFNILYTFIFFCLKEKCATIKFSNLRAGFDVYSFLQVCSEHITQL